MDTQFNPDEFAEIQAARQLIEDGRKQHIEGLMNMAKKFRQARMECGSDKAFLQWLIDENLQKIFKDANRMHKSAFRNAPILRIRK
jgi:hypothetical protein